MISDPWYRAEHSTRPPGPSKCYLHPPASLRDKYEATQSEFFVVHNKDAKTPSTPAASTQQQLEETLVATKNWYLQNGGPLGTKQNR